MNGRRESPAEPRDEARVALVTGAGRGIGREIAVHLARDGCAVGLVARSAGELAETAELVEQAGGPAVAVVGDVTDPEDVVRFCADVTASLGPLDIVVNNAAYAGPLRPFLETELDQWQRALATNVLGPVHVLRAVLPEMLRRARGYVINLNSLQGSDPSGSPLPYGVSKAALMRLTDGLATQLADSGVVIVDLSPGLVRTAMTSGRPDLDALPESAWSPVDAAARQVVNLVSGRYDVLHGRFVRATDDLDALCVRVKGDPTARLLRLHAREVAVPL